MKIVEVILSLMPGGVERFTVDLSNELSKTNEVYLLTLQADEQNRDDSLFFKTELSEKVTHIHIGMKRARTVTGQLNVARTIAEINPDIVHYQSLGSLRHSFFALYSLSFKYRTFVTVHSDLKGGYDKGLFRFVCNTLGIIHKVTIICLSQRNYKDFVEYYPQLNIKHIDNGRSPLKQTNLYELVCREMNGFRTDSQTRLFIHAARCCPAKNQKLLIDSFNELIEEGYNISLVVIGIGYDTEDGAKLKEISNGRIHFLGLKENVGDYMLNSDLFCLSSLYEGMPITLLESKSAGIPAVSTPVCGAVDLIKNGVDGVISDDFTIVSYKNAIVKSLEIYNELNSNIAREKEKGYYSIARCAKQYIECFSSDD